MNNNNQKSNTRQYSTTTYSSRNKRNRKHNQNKLVFFILLAILILALIVAIVFVIADLVGAGKDDETSGIPSDSNTPGIISDGHAMSNAYDGDDATYMLSVTKQTVGSYFSCEFEAAADVGSIRFVSSEPDYFVRGCEIQLKVNGEWVSIGVFGTSAGDKEYTVGNIPAKATAVRVYLTENADVLWAINELSVKDTSGAAVALRSPAAGTNSQTEIPDESGNATEPDQSEVTTTPGGNVTDEITTGRVDHGTTTIVVSNDNMHTGDLILVNSQYEYRFPTSNASLITVYNEYVANDLRCNYFDDTSMQLQATAAHSILAMANALYSEKELNWLKLGTGYRSFEVQQDLSNRYPATAALPGYSEHHTGLGVDLQVWDRTAGVTYNLDDPNQNCQTIYSWISANAYKYGFVRRFAPNKDQYTGITSDRWHYRYVGVPHAYYMTANDLCLEQYLAALEQCTYGGNHLIFDVDGTSYEIYYVPAVAGGSTTIPVPADPSIYTISGNNYSGFIVTITRN